MSQTNIVNHSFIYFNLKFIAFCKTENGMILAMVFKFAIKHGLHYKYLHFWSTQADLKNAQWLSNELRFTI